MTELRELHQESISIIYRTHQIYCGIKGKEIILRTGNPPGRTDGESFIILPIEDAEADIIHKHEWSHVFFKSNLRARAAFVDAYVSDLDRRGLVPIGCRESTCEFLHLLANALDDLRTNSLWALIYPLSAEYIEERWKYIVINAKRYKFDLVMYLMGLGLGIEEEMESSTFSKYRTIFLDAISKVRHSGFLSCLLQTRWIVESIIQGSSLDQAGTASYVPPAGEPPAGARMPVLSRAATAPQTEVKNDEILRMVNGVLRTTRQDKAAGDGWKLMDTDTMPAASDPDRHGTQATVQAALGVSSQQQVILMLQQGQQEVERVLEELRSHTLGLTPTQRLTKGIDDQVMVQKVKPEDVRPLLLEKRDERLVQTMRHSFIRLMDKSRRARDSSGTVLDPEAYIDLITGSGDGDIFEETENARGFSSLVLLDMSGSMQPKWKAISRACMVLAKAMKFPFSQFEVWGFTSDSGVTRMLHFTDPEHGYELKRMEWGLTPLHLAVEVGIRRVQLMPGSAHHLFVLTDGRPTHISRGPGVLSDPTSLMAEVAAKVSEARKKKVNVAALLGGYDISDEVASLMFGGPRFWTRIYEKQSDLFEVLVELVAKAFTKYLRGC